MKPCKIYCRELPLSYHRVRPYDAWLGDDGMVVLDHSLREKQPVPAMIVDGKPYYSPADALAMEIEPFGVLLPFSVDGKWGYCDRWQGDVVIPARFSYCEPFFPVPEHREIARFSAVGEYSPKEFTSSPFEQMNWANDLPDGQWGYLDLDGNEVIPPVYQYLTRIENGVILAKKDGVWGVLDTFGNTVSEFRWNAVCFDEDFGFITREDTPDGSRYAIFDRFGIKLIGDLPAMPQRDVDSLFRRFPEQPETLSFDAKVEAELGLWRYWGHAGPGYCRYYYHDGEYGYLQCFPATSHRSGEIYHHPPNVRDYIAHQEDVLAFLLHHRSHETEAVEKQKKKVEEVRTLYPETRERMEEMIDSLNERVARFLSNRDAQPWALEDDRLLGPGSWPRPCRIHTYGGEIIEGQWMPSGQVQFPVRHEDKLTYLPLPLEADGKWGYCNAKRAVFPPQWGFCDHFERDIARFNLYEGYDPSISDFYSEEETNHNNPGFEGRWGLLRDDGRLVDESFYQYISRECHGWRIAKKDGFWGVMTDEGEIWEDCLIWDDMWFRHWQCCVVIAKKNTRHGPRYAIFTEEGSLLLSGLKHPDQLDQLYEEEYCNG